MNVFQMATARQLRAIVEYNHSHMDLTHVIEFTPVGEVTFEFTPKLTVLDIIKQLDGEIGTRAIVQEVL